MVCCHKMLNFVSKLIDMVNTKAKQIRIRAIEDLLVNIGH